MWPSGDRLPFAKAVRQEAISKFAKWGNPLIPARFCADNTTLDCTCTFGVYQPEIHLESQNISRSSYSRRINRHKVWF